MPTHAKMPSAMKRGMCAHGGALRCGMGCYAEGGEVTHHSPAGGSANRAKGADRVKREAGQKGIHTSNNVYSPGESRAGEYTRDAKYGGMEPSANRQYREASREMHKDKLSELKSMKGPHGNYAEGGDVEPLESPMEGDGDQEIEHALAGELLSAMEKKDKQGIVDAIEALVMQCMSKGKM